MPCHSIKEFARVKEQFNLGYPFDPKELDSRTTWAHSYMGVQWSEIEKVRKDYDS